jgi:hypothetical protein
MLPLESSPGQSNASMPVGTTSPVVIVEVPVALPVVVVAVFVTVVVDVAHIALLEQAGNHS